VYSLWGNSKGRGLRISNEELGISHRVHRGIKEKAERMRRNGFRI
jgi:hypothetical protein